MYKHKKLSGKSEEKGDKMNFDPNHVTYMCCCNSIQAKQGILLIGIVSTVVLVFSIATLPFSTSDRSASFFLQFALLLVDLLAVLLLFRAYRTNNHVFLVPYIALEVAYIVSLLTGVVICVYGFFYPSSGVSELLVKYFLDLNEAGEDTERKVTADEVEVARVITAFASITLSLVALVTLWWTKVTVNCYFYFQHLRAHREAEGGKHVNRYQASSHHIEHIA